MLIFKSIKKCTRIYLWKRLIFLVIVIGGVTVYFFLDQTSADECHYLTEGDTLKSTEDLDFIPQPNSIFFHETSCKGNLTPRQACAVEAAARIHPEIEVYVLFSAPVSELSFATGSLHKLRILKNLRFARVHITEYAKFTPLEHMVARRPFRRSRWWKERTSDILKYLTLYKYGGVYLDTDMYVVKNLSPLGRNWVAKEDDDSFNGAAIAMSRDKVGRNFINTLLNSVDGAYTSDDLIHDHKDRFIGPDAFVQVLEKFCKTGNRSLWSAATCEGVRVYNGDYFYPVHEMFHAEYFRLGSLYDALVTDNTYAYHLWNRFTFNMTVEQDSPFSRMAPLYCPTMYQMSGEEFGS